MAEFFDIELTGCRPEPLGSYLKALGVLRLVAEQKDKDAAGYWRGDHFVLCSSLDADALIAFFENEWTPSPIAAPWNGGSGFTETTSDKGWIATLRSGRATELKAEMPLLREAAKLFPDDSARAIQWLRSVASDSFVSWLDSVSVAVRNSGPLQKHSSPVLGTGGNDGRRDYTQNNSLALATLFARLSEGHDPALGAELFGTAFACRTREAYAPGAFAANIPAGANPWLLPLVMEGCLALGGAATRLFENGIEASSFPFVFRSGASNDGSLHDRDSIKMDNRGNVVGGTFELWAPLWPFPSRWREIKALFSTSRIGETRAGKFRSAAAAALAMRVSASSTGIHSFVRYQFCQRDGANSYAVPAGRLTVGDIDREFLEDELHEWLATVDDIRLKAIKNTKAVKPPAQFFRDARLLQATLGQGRLEEVLLALGILEMALGRSLAFSREQRLLPVPMLSAPWAGCVPDVAEARLGVCLGQRIGFRRRLLPIDVDKPGQWGRADDAGVVFSERPLIDNLHALLQRDDVEAQQREVMSPDENVKAFCHLSDIARFIDGDVDDVAIERWARAASLLSRPPRFDAYDDAIGVPATFTVLRLVHSGSLHDKTQLKRTATMLARACAGDSVGATTAALQRLSAVGRALPVPALVEPSQRMRRIAAALAFPLTVRQRRRLQGLVLPPTSREAPSPSSELQPQQENV